MNFRTEIPLQPSDLKFSHRTSFFVAGSCFAERIGQWLNTYRFSTELNPNGTLFHPIPLARTLGRILNQNHYQTNDLILHNNRYCSFDHHGAFSGTDSLALLKLMNDKLQTACRTLQLADALIITWGSAWAYHSQSHGLVVANCHKMPQQNFRKELTPHDKIYQEWTLFIQTLRSVNPTIQIIISVSPVRYLRDGVHGNQVSKAHLMLAADALANNFEGVHYFPAYEILLDELRDYRFYAEDMLHPTKQAVDFIISKFETMYLSTECISTVRQIEPLIKFIHHRPLHVDSDRWKEMTQVRELEIQSIVEASTAK